MNFRLSPAFRHALLVFPLLGVQLLILPGCKPMEVVSTPIETTPDEVFAGRLDWSAWQRWVQSPPRMVLVSDIDDITLSRIATQSRLFQSVITPPPPTTGDLTQTQIDAFRTDFMASSDRSHNSPVPNIDRWDRYTNSVKRLRPDNVAITITTLEAFVRRDTQDLTPQATSTGNIGTQARAELDWIDRVVLRLVESLKESQIPPKTTSTLLPPEEARKQWQLFETTELPKISQSIDPRIRAEAQLTDDGTYSLQGHGKLVAIVTVAGRNLYFPADTAPDELHFETQ